MDLALGQKKQRCRHFQRLGSPRNQGFARCLFGLDRWEALSHIEAMPQATLTGGPATETEVRENAEKYQGVIDSIATLIPVATRLPVLIRLLSAAADRALQGATSRPEWTKQLLRVQGDVVIAGLVRDNWDHIGNAASVQARFGIPGSTLHRFKDNGEVIAFRPAGKDSFVFPLDQFSGKKPAPWAAEIVKGLGNGAPALQFIFTPRTSLQNRCLMDLVRAKEPGAETAIHRALRRLTAE